MVSILYKSVLNLSQIKASQATKLLLYNSVLDKNKSIYMTLSRMFSCGGA